MSCASRPTAAPEGSGPAASAAARVAGIRPWAHGTIALCYSATHMTDIVGVRELRQNLSKYLDRVKDGESLVVTERGREVARLIPVRRERVPVRRPRRAVLRHRPRRTSRDDCGAAQHSQRPGRKDGQFPRRTARRTQPLTRGGCLHRHQRDRAGAVGRARRCCSPASARRLRAACSEPADADGAAATRAARRTARGRRATARRRRADSRRRRGSHAGRNRDAATVATLDAIHLATALKLAGAGILNTVMTYDARLASAVELHGLRVAAP